MSWLNRVINFFSKEKQKLPSDREYQNNTSENLLEAKSTATSKILTSKKKNTFEKDIKKLEKEVSSNHDINDFSKIHINDKAIIPSNHVKVHQIKRNEKINKELDEKPKKSGANELTNFHNDKPIEKQIDKTNDKKKRLITELEIEIYKEMKEINKFVKERPLSFEEILKGDVKVLKNYYKYYLSRGNANEVKFLTQNIKRALKKDQKLSCEFFPYLIKQCLHSNENVRMYVLLALNEFNLERIHIEKIDTILVDEISIKIKKQLEIIKEKNKLSGISTQNIVIKPEKKRVVFGIHVNRDEEYDIPAFHTLQDDHYKTPKINEVIATISKEIPNKEMQEEKEKEKENKELIINETRNIKVDKIEKAKLHLYIRDALSNKKLIYEESVLVKKEDKQYIFDFVVYGEFCKIAIYCDWPNYNISEKNPIDINELWDIEEYFDDVIRFTSIQVFNNVESCIYSIKETIGKIDTTKHHSVEKQFLINKEKTKILRRNKQKFEKEIVEDRKEKSEINNTIESQIPLNELKVWDMVKNLPISQKNILWKLIQKSNKDNLSLYEESLENLQLLIEAGLIQKNSFYRSTSGESSLYILPQSPYLMKLLKKR